MIPTRKPRRTGDVDEQQQKYLRVKLCLNSHDINKEF